LNLEKIFDEVAFVMQAEARKTRNAISHPGSKGTAFESEFRKFLRNYFPKSVDISTGIIIDSNGQESNQVDIIISDAAKAPIFYSKDDLRVIPIECL
jgi:hypothetical protein